MQGSWEKLLESLETLGFLKDSRIREAFLNIPRSSFVPESLLKDSMRNIPLMLPCGATLSQPYIFAFILEKAIVESGNKVFLYDAGSGWEATVIASLAKEKLNHRKPFVFAQEPSEEMRKRAGERANAFMENNGIAFFTDELLAFSEAPFDRIIALKKPKDGTMDSFKRALAPGGRIVVPQGENLLVLDLLKDGTWEEKKFFGFHF